MKIFSKQKMMERLEKEGRANEIDQEIIDTMNALDGKEAVKNGFKALLFGELEYFIHYEGTNYPINPDDCIEK